MLADAVVVSGGGVMRRLGLVLASLALAGCGSMPFEVTLPDGQLLKGSATRNIHKGSYYAKNDRIACTGSYDPSMLGGDMDLRAHCSNGLKGSGIGEAGRGRITMENGQTASFRYGDELKSP
jgi:hypothetical protein